MNINDTGAQLINLKKDAVEIKKKLYKFMEMTRENIKLTDERVDMLLEYMRELQEHVAYLMGNSKDKKNKGANVRISTSPDSIKESTIKRVKNTIRQEAFNVILEQTDCAPVRKKDLEALKTQVDAACRYLNYHIDTVLKELKPKNINKPRYVGISEPDTENSGVTHTVVKGDTFYELARTYLGNPKRWSEIQKANPRDDGSLIPPRRLPIGTVLTIPSKVQENTMLQQYINEELGNKLNDPISPSNEPTERSEIINSLRDGLILCLNKIEVQEEIDYELVMLLDNALKRAEALSGKKPFQPE